MIWKTLTLLFAYNKNRIFLFSRLALPMELNVFIQNFNESISISIYFLYIHFPLVQKKETHSC